MIQNQASIPLANNLQYRDACRGQTLTSQTLTASRASPRELLVAALHPKLAEDGLFRRAHSPRPTKRRVILLVVLEVDLGPHKYTYVHGDPIMGVDPSGEMHISAAVVQLGIIGGIVGAAAGFTKSLIDLQRQNAGYEASFVGGAFSVKAYEFPFADGKMGIKFGGKRVLQSRGKNLPDAPPVFFGPYLPTQVGFSASGGGQVKFIQFVRHLSRSSERFVGGGIRPDMTPYPSRGNATGSNRLNENWRINNIVQDDGWHLDVFGTSKDAFYRGQTSDPKFGRNRYDSFVQDRPGLSSSSLFEHDHVQEFVAFAVRDNGGGQVEILGGISWAIKHTNSYLRQIHYVLGAQDHNYPSVEVVEPKPITTISPQLIDAINLYNGEFSDTLVVN